MEKNDGINGERNMIKNGEKPNFQKEMEQVIATLGDRKPSLLLHSCCGPCSSAVLERLQEHFRITLLYYNPNIEPEEEYRHRLSEQKRLLTLLPFRVGMMECEYDHARFAAFAEGMSEYPEGGKRCLSCFRLRMEETARRAKENGFDFFTTTLSVSPHKNAALLDMAGQEAEKKYGVRYLPADFKKKNGYLRSLELSSEYQLYRQDYCGCLYGKPKQEDI